MSWKAAKTQDEFQKVFLCEITVALTTSRIRWNEQIFKKFHYHALIPPTIKKAKSITYSGTGGAVQILPQV